MRRRRFLEASGTLAVGCLAGCAGPADTGPSGKVPGPPEPPDDDRERNGGKLLSVASFDYGSNDAGDLVVTAVVANDAGFEREATLRVTASVNEWTEQTETTAAVPASGDRAFVVAFDLPAAAFRDGGELDFELV